MYSEREYHGGHPIPGVFEVFSFEDPAGEIRGIFLFMILPVTIATLLVLFARYVWMKRSNRRFQIYEFLPKDTMTGILLCYFYVWIFLTIYSVTGPFQMAAMAIIATLPPLLILGPILIANIFIRRRGGKSASWFLYLASFVALASEYFWLGAIGRS